MPKKKGAKTTAAKKTLKRDIKNAANSIPNLIMGDFATGTTETIVPPPPAKPKVTIEIRNPHPHRHTIWIGVGVLSLLVFGMWFQNAKKILSEIRLTTIPEARIATGAVNNIQKALADAQTRDDSHDQKNAATERITAILKVQYALAATVSSTTSTVETSTTTPVAPSTSTVEVSP